MHKLFVYLLLIVTLLLVACGGDAVDEPLPTANDSAETEITETDAVAEPEESEPSIVFAETFTNEAGGFSASVPEGLTVTLADATAEIVSTDETAEVFFNILSSPYAESDEEVTLDSIIDEFAGLLGELGEPTPIMIGGIEGIQVDFSVDDPEISFEGRMAAVLADTHGVILMAGADSWEERGMEALFLAISGSIEIFDPVAPSAE